MKNLEQNGDRVKIQKFSWNLAVCMQPRPSEVAGILWQLETVGLHVRATLIRAWSKPSLNDDTCKL